MLSLRAWFDPSGTFIKDKLSVVDKLVHDEEGPAGERCGEARGNHSWVAGQYFNCQALKNPMPWESGNITAKYNQ